MILNLTWRKNEDIVWIVWIALRTLTFELSESKMTYLSWSIWTTADLVFGSCFIFQLFWEISFGFCFWKRPTGQNEH